MKMLSLYILSGIIGLAALYSGLSGHRLLFISGARSAVIVLTAAGFLMCTFGAIGAFVTKAPLHPLTLTGYVLGFLALFAAVVQILGLKVPFLSNPNYALIFIAIVIIVKLVIARLNFLLPAN